MKKIVLTFSLLLIALMLIACTPTDNIIDPDPDDDNDTEPVIDFTDYESLFVGDWNRPGLYDKAGNPHEMPSEVAKTGLTIDVTHFGAKPNDASFDNFVAFRDAIAAAEPGDEVFIPEGTYHFVGYVARDGYYSHIYLKSGIILRGAGEDKTFLLSKFSEHANQNNQTSVITLVNSQNVLLEDFTITSPVLDEELPDPNLSNFTSSVFKGPVNGIVIDTLGAITNPADQTQNIVVRNVTIERFRRMGVRLKQSRNVTIDTITVQKATNLGGGGAGYGISIQGQGWNVDWTDTTKDTVHNIVMNSNFVGPYLRHGILLQYHAHNNLITNNTLTDNLLDAIDLHGEDEYSNEISYNTILNTRAGAGVGVGNSGATHDAAGRNNYIHNNIIDGGLRGIDVILGSPRTIIKDNVIKNLTLPRSNGITLNDAPYTFIIQNDFENITGDNEGHGIKAVYAYDPFEPELGIPDNLSIIGNTFNNVKRGVYIQTHTDNFMYEDNVFTNIAEFEFKTDKDTFVVPGTSTLMVPVQGFEILPTDVTFISTEIKDFTHYQKNMKFKASAIEPQFNRMIYARFDITESSNITFNKVYLSFAAKAQEGQPTINIWGTPSYTDWNQNTITWNNALYHHPDLAVIQFDEQSDDLTKVVDFQFPVPGYVFNTYYIDITEWIEMVDSNVFTFILSNDAIEEVYMEIYNNEQVASNQHFRLIFK